MLEGIQSRNSQLDLNFLKGYDVPAGGSQATSRGIGSQAQQAPNPEQVNGQRSPATADESKVKADNQENQSQKTSTGPKNETDLSDEEKKQVQELKETDRKVRQHEMAHLAASAGIAISGANFSYKRGPDGINYAVGGDVKIDVSKESTPQATIQKAQKIAAAAMAPADPSPQDRAVAAKARAMEADARVEQTKEQQEKSSGQQKESSNTNATHESQPTATNQTSNTSAINRPNPGIEAYKQNQTFAPTPTPQENQNMINTVSSIPGGGFQASRGFIVDIAA